MDKEETKKVKVFCNKCNVTTNHSLKCEYEVKDIIEWEEDGVKETHCGGSFRYQIIECKGCESISYRSVEYFNQFMEFDTDTGEPKVTNGKTFQTFYPERLQNSITEKRVTGLPIVIRKTYQEVIQCYNFDMRILCSAGLRAIVEGICNHYSISGKTLGDRIDALGKNGLISIELSKSLHSHKFLGNYALHRLEIPEKKELEKSIHLLELAFETLFGVPEKTKKLSKLITNRVKD